MSIEGNQETPSQTIHDPTTGETITFVESAAESNGGQLVIRLTLVPGGFVPPHAHPSQESFECLEGQLQFQLDGRSIELSPGSTVTVPPGKVHGFRNVSRASVTLHIVATPGAEVEYGLRVKVALSQDGFSTSDGRPKDLLLGAVILRQTELYMPPLPQWLYWPLIAALAALGRRQGREQLLLDRYPDYARLLDVHRRQSQGA